MTQKSMIMAIFLLAHISIDMHSQEKSYCINIPKLDRNRHIIWMSQETDTRLILETAHLCFQKIDYSEISASASSKRQLFEIYFKNTDLNWVYNESLNILEVTEKNIKLVENNILRDFVRPCNHVFNNDKYILSILTQKMDHTGYYRDYYVGWNYGSLLDDDYLPGRSINYTVSLSEKTMLKEILRDTLVKGIYHGVVCSTGIPVEGNEIDIGDAFWVYYEDLYDTNMDLRADLEYMHNEDFYTYRLARAVLTFKRALMISENDTISFLRNSDLLRFRKSCDSIWMAWEALSEKPSEECKDILIETALKLELSDIEDIITYLPSIDSYNGKYKTELSKMLNNDKLSTIVKEYREAVEESREETKSYTIQLVDNEVKFAENGKETKKIIEFDIIGLIMLGSAILTMVILMIVWKIRWKNSHQE